MRTQGSYKIAQGERRFDALVDPALRSERRLQRILESLRAQITGSGDGQNLRIRLIFRSPREIYRLEINLPELGGQRTTLLDRDALEELLAWDDVRARVSDNGFARSGISADG